MKTHLKTSTFENEDLSRDFKKGFLKMATSVMWLNHVNFTYGAKNTPKQARKDTCMLTSLLLSWWSCKCALAKLHVHVLYVKVMSSYSISSFLSTVLYACKHFNLCKELLPGVFANRHVPCKCSLTSHSCLVHVYKILCIYLLLCI